MSGNEISNPFQQLKRTESLFRRFLKNHSFHYTVEPYLIFINPEFHLYNAPRNPQIIFPNQLNRFMEKLKKKSATRTKNHLKLIEKLLSCQVQGLPYRNLPKYSFNDLKKGIPCSECQSFYASFLRKNLACSHCGHKEDVTCAVIRSIEEFKILFPEAKITSMIIHEWCKIIPLQTIQRILSKNFKLFGHGKSAFYVK